MRWSIRARTDGGRHGGQEHSAVPGPTRPTYSTAARRFHWWTVLLVAAQVPIGLFMVRYGAATNFAEPTGKLYDIHKLIGLTILLLALARLTYRLAHGAPADEPTLEPLGEGGEPHHPLGDLRAAHRCAAAGLARRFLLWAVRAVRHQAAGAGRAGRRQGDEACSSSHMLAAYAPDRAAWACTWARALMHYVIKKDGVLARMWVRAGRLS